jgi:hypothetical protein
MEGTIDTRHTLCDSSSMRVATQDIVAYVIDESAAALAAASQQLVGGAFGTKQHGCIAEIVRQLAECGVPSALAAALALPPLATGVASHTQCLLDLAACSLSLDGLEASLQFAIAPVQLPRWQHRTVAPSFSQMCLSLSPQPPKLRLRPWRRRTSRQPSALLLAHRSPGQHCWRLRTPLRVLLA